MIHSRASGFRGVDSYSSFILKRKYRVTTIFAGDTHMFRTKYPQIHLVWFKVFVVVYSDTFFLQIILILVFSLGFKYIVRNKINILANEE